MNESEREFVEYLQLRGYGEPERHPSLNGNKRGKRPDFGLRLDSTRFFFEVKEFAERDLPPSGAIDPYAPMHNKIEATLGQIDEYKGHPCSLMLYSPDASFRHLTPAFVFGSALGPLSWLASVDPNTGDRRERSFWDSSKGWYWFDYEQMQPKNTHLVSIIILERFPIGQHRLSIEWERRAEALGRRLTFAETDELLRQPGLDLGEKTLRVVVCEHPYAESKLKSDLFAGEFDERFGWVPASEGLYTKRLFAGTEIRFLEATGFYPAVSPFLRKTRKPNPEKS